MAGLLHGKPTYGWVQRSSSKPITIDHQKLSPNSTLSLSFLWVGAMNFLNIPQEPYPPPGYAHPYPPPPGYPTAIPPPPGPAGYQGYFSEGYPPPPPPPPPQQYQHQHYDYHHESGCSSFLTACLAALCCCCVLEECCM
ncbi:hypothetical protein L1049_005799 [Liquidambar formosana]|uniref:Cysteine-rich transmembrane CYSTM domain-containing protein n=1 Tax=Liquidambar formosana TaxID=63359 RepID=A0AAP0RGA4_LIQFO